MFDPRGAIHANAGGKVEDTGPVTKQRMKTVDEEFLAATLDFVDRAHKAKKPFFVWFNSTRMHISTRLKSEAEGVTGQGLYAEGMVEQDSHVGQLLDKLDQSGISDNTMVVYTTDSSAELLLWPDGGYIPYRGEKNTNWEGGCRVPMLVRWPGKIKPNQVSSEIIAMMDWMPTRMAAAGDTRTTSKLKKSTRVGQKTYMVHLVGSLGHVGSRSMLMDFSPRLPRNRQ